MPLFTYRALDDRGKSLKGSLVAATEREAREVLRGRAIYPLDVRSSRPLGETMRGWLRMGRTPRVAPKDLAAFTRQLATLLEATIPYDSALGMIHQQTTHLGFRTVLGNVRARVVEGAYLADAMTNVGGYFPPMLINMVRSGESSGTLVVVLKRLADYFDNVSRIRTRIAGALVYPIFMTVFATGVVIFMVTYILPKITRLFTNFGGVLPLPTRILIGVSDVMIGYWWLLLLGLLAVVWVGGWLLRKEQGRLFMDRLELAVPVLRDFRRKLILQRLTETLATMLGSGVELHQALRVSSDVVENRVYLKAMEHVIFDIQNRGMQFSVALARTGLFPDDMCQMIAIGEETATLDTMLDNVSRRLAQEVNSTTDSLMALFEPLMILMMGGGVGFIVVAILLPMLQLNQLVR